jgi:hypothetical protein
MTTYYHLRTLSNIDWLYIKKKRGRYRNYSAVVDRLSTYMDFRLQVGIEQ